MLEGMEQYQTLLYLAYGMLGLSVFILANMILKESQAREAAEALGESGDRNASNGLVKLTRPFFTQYVVPMIRGKPFWDDRRKIYRRKLISGGLKKELTPDEFIAFKMFLIIFFPIVGGLLKSLEVIDVSLPIILLSGVAGYFYPDLWVKGRIEARHKKIRKAMPFIVDLLALSTEAGLDFLGAIGKVVEKAAPSPLVEEFEQVLKEIKVGASRTEALREMGVRVNMPEINSFIAILISAEQMGAPIGKTLKAQSEKVRNDRFLMAEKAGAAATPKLILATVILILPAVILVSLGPMAISFISGEGAASGF
jgi:tight adherence protein C